MGLLHRGSSDFKSDEVDGNIRLPSETNLESRANFINRRVQDRCASQFARTYADRFLRGREKQMYNSDNLVARESDEILSVA